MNTQELEQKLDDLVTAAVDSGMILNEVISAFELKLEELREEASETDG